jgi:hypothetical protein
MKRNVNHMTIKADLAELEWQHEAIENEIAEALAHSSTDDLKIAELKRRKLILKDEIERVPHVDFSHSILSKRPLRGLLVVLVACFRKKGAQCSGVSATPTSNVMALRKKSQFPTRMDALGFRSAHTPGLNLVHARTSATP